MKTIKDKRLQEKIYIYLENPLLKEELLFLPSKKNTRNVEMFDRYLTTDASLAKIAKENNITTERVRQIICKYARIAEHKYKWSKLKLI